MEKSKPVSIEELMKEPEHTLAWRWRSALGYISTKWYEFTCWAWYRWTTIKPRYLGHTWQDPDGLIPHLMFEVMSRHFEQGVLPMYEWNKKLWDKKKPYDFSGIQKSYSDRIAEDEAEIKKLQADLLKAESEKEKKELSDDIWCKERELEGELQNRQYFTDISNLYLWYHCEWGPILKQEREGHYPSGWKNNPEDEDIFYQKMLDQCKKLIDLLPGMWT